MDLLLKLLLPLAGIVALPAPAWAQRPFAGPAIEVTSVMGTASTSFFQNGLPCGASQTQKVNEPAARTSCSGGLSVASSRLSARGSSLTLRTSAKVVPSLGSGTTGIANANVVVQFVVPPGRNAFVDVRIDGLSTVTVVYPGGQPGPTIMKDTMLILSAGTYTIGLGSASFADAGEETDETFAAAEIKPFKTIRV